MERLFWICLAGGAGTGSRYLIGAWAAQRFGSTFPYGTVIVNLAGCFAVAALMTLEKVRVLKYAAGGNRHERPQ